MAAAFETIVALSSGALPSGVAVIRCSGSLCRMIWEAVIGGLVQVRKPLLRTVRDPRSGESLDRGLVLFFEGPASFTGEDCLELQLHGGRAVIKSVLDVLCSFPNVRLAEAGEFTRRAFANGKIDLTEAEGLADLLNAETRQQQRQALRLSSGALRERAEGWRSGVLRAMALVEASIDFADEGDVSGDYADEIIAEIIQVRKEILRVLDEASVGERIRDGFSIALLGPPNAGKSSLLNALAGRDVAIVSATPGTTRDVLTAYLDIDGYAVIVSDTAGLRETGEEIEVEGIRRARDVASRCDLVLWLSDDQTEAEAAVKDVGVEIWQLASKRDLGADVPVGWIGISVREAGGLDNLIARLGNHLKTMSGGGEAALVSHKRQEQCLAACAEALGESVGLAQGSGLELAAEELRRSAFALGKLVGQIDVEDVLGEIFSSFCIGK